MGKFLKLFICILLLCCFINIDVYAKNKTSSYTVSMNSNDTYFSLSKNYINIVYKNIGTNSYNYNGRSVINCKSSDTRYATCSVDSKNKKIIVNSVKVTNQPITITVTAASKYRHVKNNASISYGDGETIFLNELKNPVDVKAGNIVVPDTASTITKIGIIAGLGLIAYGGYIIYRKYGIPILKK